MSLAWNGSESRHPFKFSASKLSRLFERHAIQLALSVAIDSVCMFGMVCGPGDPIDQHVSEQHVKIASVRRGLLGCPFAALLLLDNRRVGGPRGLPMPEQRLSPLPLRLMRASVPTQTLKLDSKAHPPSWLCRQRLELTLIHVSKANPSALAQRHHRWDQKDRRFTFDRQRVLEEHWKVPVHKEDQTLQPPCL
jgi:hypothetical protein